MKDHARGLEVAALSVDDESEGCAETREPHPIAPHSVGRAAPTTFVEGAVVLR